MKTYEHAHRRRVGAGQYLLLRLDGRAFHTYTRGLGRPFDLPLMDAMDQAMIELCRAVPGVRLGYVESDEISLLLTDWREREGDAPATEWWMGGVEAKILSLTSSICTAKFNEVRNSQVADGIIASPASFAQFDSRLWTFPGTEEGAILVKRYFAWRRRDSIKNSVTMAALSQYGPKLLEGVKTEEKQAMLRRDGASWDALPEGFKFGRVGVKELREETVTYVHKRTGETHEARALRSHWTLKAADDLEAIWCGETLPDPKFARSSSSV